MHQKVISSLPSAWLFCINCVHTPSVIYTIIVVSIISVIIPFTINSILKTFVAFKKLFQPRRNIHKFCHFKNVNSQRLEKFRQIFDPEFQSRAKRGCEVKRRINRDQYSTPSGMKMEVIQEASPYVVGTDTDPCTPRPRKRSTSPSTSVRVPTLFQPQQEASKGHKDVQISSKGPQRKPDLDYKQVSPTSSGRSTKHSHRGTAHVSTKEVQLYYKSLLQMKFHQRVELDHQINVPPICQIERITPNQLTLHAVAFEPLPWWLKKSGWFSGQRVNGSFYGTDDVERLALCTSPHGRKNESGMANKLMEDNKENAVIGIQARCHAQLVQTHQMKQHQSAVTIQEITLQYSDVDMQSMNDNMDFSISRSGNRSGSPVGSRFPKIGSYFETKSTLEYPRPASRKLASDVEKGKASAQKKGSQRKLVPVLGPQAPASPKIPTSKKGLARGKKTTNPKKQSKLHFWKKGSAKDSPQRKIPPPQMVSQSKSHHKYQKVLRATMASAKSVLQGITRIKITKFEITNRH